MKAQRRIYPPGDVRFERADLGREYSHVNNAIPEPAVTAIAALSSGEDGSMNLPRSLAAPPPAFTVVAGKVAPTTDSRR